MRLEKKVRRGLRLMFSLCAISLITPGAGSTVQSGSGNFVQGDEGKQENPARQDSREKVRQPMTAMDPPITV